jgi:hypothetical protein
VLGLVLAAIGSITFGCTVAYITRGAPIGRKKLILATGLFPFICLGWAAAVFAFQAVMIG